MSESQQAQAAADEPPDNPENDPEVAALLDFEPVPRKREVDGGWTPELQREFIARLAVVGSPGRACEEMGKDLTGMMKVYRSPLAKSFRASWDGAVALAKRRQAERVAQEYVSPGSRPPSLDNRRKWRVPMANPQPDEDEAAMMRLAEEARESVSRKLLNARRLYLQEICDSPGKRAAFEILTELPIDWEKAERLEPQADEPRRRLNVHQPDMVLTAESGWSFGECGYGPDKKAEMRKAVDEHRAAQGLPPVEWEE